MARQIRPASGIPAGVRAGLVLGLPMIGAISVVCIYLNKEILVAAAWVALGMAALVFVEPLIGVGAMTAMFVLVAYPTLLADLGFLTINNLLGLCLAVVFAGRIITTRDLSVFRLRTVLLFTLIGAVFVISTAHVPVAFPTLRVSQGTGIYGKDLDRTAYMMHDFWVRLGYIVLFAFFVRGGRDVRAMFYVFALVLFLAVPSALVNWWNGTLSHGFRTEASLTAGSNPNRLAMICLMQIARGSPRSRWEAPSSSCSPRAHVAASSAVPCSACSCRPARAATGSRSCRSPCWRSPARSRSRPSSLPRHGNARSPSMRRIATPARRCRSWRASRPSRPASRWCATTPSSASVSGTSARCPVRSTSIRSSGRPTTRPCGR